MEKNCLLHTQQRKINYYRNLNEKDIKDNKKFWKTVKPFLSDKSINSDKINLSENGELINSKSKTAEILNDFLEYSEKLKNSGV